MKGTPFVKNASTSGPGITPVEDSGSRALPGSRCGPGILPVSTAQIHEQTRIAAFAGLLALKADLPTRNGANRSHGASYELAGAQLAAVKATRGVGPYRCLLPSRVSRNAGR